MTMKPDSGDLTDQEAALLAALADSVITIVQAALTAWSRAAPRRDNRRRDTLSLLSAAGILAATAAHFSKQPLADALDVAGKQAAEYYGQLTARDLKGDL